MYIINTQKLYKDNCQTPIECTKIKFSKWKEINLLEMMSSKDVSSILTQGLQIVKGSPLKRIKFAGYFYWLDFLTTWEADRDIHTSPQYEKQIKFSSKMKFYKNSYLHVNQPIIQDTARPNQRKLSRFGKKMQVVILKYYISSLKVHPTQTCELSEIKYPPAKLMDFYSSFSPIAFFRLEDKLTVHFSFNKFIGIAPDFRKHICQKTKKKVVIYRVSVSHIWIVWPSGYKFNLKLHSFSIFFVFSLKYS